MSAIELFEAAKALPLEERIELTQRLRDDLAENGFDLDLTPEEVTELERRAEEFKNNPNSGVPWEQVRDEVRERYGWK